MKLKFASFLLTGLFAIALHHPAKAQTPPKAEIPGTQVITYTSSVVSGQEYKLLINLPRNYERDSAKTYPVLYLLDGQFDFPLFTGIYGSQYYDGFIPGFVTVAITWGGKDPDAGTLRGRDFTPTKVAGMQSGNGPKFLEFIKTELIPFIKSKYRVNDDRTLTGSSYGGLFTLFAFFSEPSLFNRYVLTSPSLGWDNSVLRTWETKYEAIGSAAPTRLFMGRGQLEGNDPAFMQLADRLKKVKNLEVQTLVMENTGHSGTKAEGYTRGLQFVFQPPALQLPAAILDKYAGAYVLGKDTARLAAKNGKLIVLPESNNLALLPASDKDFYRSGSFLKIHFKMDATGAVTGCQVEQYDGEMFYKKVK